MQVFFIVSIDALEASFFLFFEIDISLKPEYKDLDF